MRLYSYWRSSAAYRVRIALQLKGLEHELVPISLVDDEHRTDTYRTRNPQGLVPFLEDGEIALGQSQAILEYLDEAYPKVPLLPHGAARRGQARALAALICCDIHPLNNLRVLRHLRDELGVSPEQQSAWIRHWIAAGFEAFEALVAPFAAEGPYALGESLCLADLCLVPQMYNARRFRVPVDAYPRLVAIVDACNELSAFAAAAPERQPDRGEGSP
jgi:maleylacetoacetate isomerase